MRYRRSIGLHFIQPYLRGLARHYGHASGADAFFLSVKDLPGNKTAESTPTFLKTHPGTQDRIELLRALAQQNGWAMDRPTVAIPEAIQALVRKQAGREG